MYQYETVMILTPVLSDEEVRKTVDRYKKILQEAGAEMVFEHPWGLRQLAYPIQNKTTGIYHLIEYKAPGDVHPKMDVQFGRDDQVLRHMTTRLDKYAVAYNIRQREKRENAKKEAENAEVQTQKEEA